MQRSGLAVERLAAQEAEGVVSGARGVGVDRRQVELVRSRDEVRDHVTLAQHRARFAIGIDEAVRARAAGERVHPRLAGNHVVAFVADDLVACAIAGAGYVPRSRRQGQVLHPVAQRVADRRLHQVGPFVASGQRSHRIGRLATDAALPRLRRTVQKHRVLLAPAALVQNVLLAVPVQIHQPTGRPVRPDRQHHRRLAHPVLDQLQFGNVGRGIHQQHIHLAVRVQVHRPLDRESRRRYVRRSAGFHHDVPGVIHHVYVVALAAFQPVRSRASVQYVVPGIAPQHVVAAKTGHEIVAGVAIDKIGQTVANAIAVLQACKREVLDVVWQRVGSADANLVDAFVRQFDYGLLICCSGICAANKINIISSPTCQGVVPTAPLQGIVAVAPGEEIVVGVAIENIGQFVPGAVDGRQSG